MAVIMNMILRFSGFMFWSGVLWLLMSITNLVESDISILWSERFLSVSIFAFLIWCTIYYYIEYKKDECGKRNLKYDD